MQFFRFQDGFILTQKFFRRRRRRNSNCFSSRPKVFFCATPPSKNFSKTLSSTHPRSTKGRARAEQDQSFFKWAIRGLFFRYLRLFNSKQSTCKMLLTTGFYPCTSCIGCDCSANWATTAARVETKFFP